MSLLQVHIERDIRAQKAKLEAIAKESAEDPTPYGPELVTDPGGSLTYQNWNTPCPTQ